MAKTTRISKVYTISMPPEMAKKAEALAKQENRTMSELFREAFRSYNTARVQKFMEEVGEYAKTRNPNGYTEEDIPRLIKETRAEQERAEKASSKATPMRKTA